MPDRPGAAAAIFSALADAELQRRHDHPERAARATGATPRCRSRSRTEDLRDRRGGARAGRSASSASPSSTPTARSARSRSSAPACARIPGVAAKVFQTLADEGINIEMISTSPIKISCVIRADSVPQAVRALHTAFEPRRRRRSRPRAVRRGAAMSARLPRRGRRRHRRRRHGSMLAVLQERGFPADEIVLFATARSAGQRDRRAHGARARRRRRPRAASTSRCSPPAAAPRGSGRRGSSRPGATVIDNSSAFRRDPEVPLVVSEVNPHALRRTTAG